MFKRKPKEITGVKRHRALRGGMHHYSLMYIAAASAHAYPGTGQATAGRIEMSWPAGAGLPWVMLLQEKGLECIWSVPLLLASVWLLTRTVTTIQL